MQGAAVVPPNRLFFGSVVTLPTDKVLPILTIIETGGLAPVYIQNSARPAYQQPAAQIVGRAGSYNTARLTAVAAYNAVLDIENELVNGVKYLYIRPLQEPFDLGPDDAGRARVAFNVLGYKARS